MITFFHRKGGNMMKKMRLFILISKSSFDLLKEDPKKFCLGLANFSIVNTQTFGYELIWGALFTQSNSPYLKKNVFIS
jgi:hypothetical protein